MISLILWLLYGIFIGLVVKAIHPGPKPIGLLSTLIIGIGGTFLGGTLTTILGFGQLSSFSSFLMAIAGGIAMLTGYRYFVLHKENRSFWEGRYLGND